MINAEEYFANTTDHLSPAELAAHQMQQGYVTEIARLRKLVRTAYNEGFTEGVKEDRSSRGGKPWQDSASKLALGDE